MGQCRNLTLLCMVRLGACGKKIYRPIRCEHGGEKSLTKFLSRQTYTQSSALYPFHKVRGCFGCVHVQLKERGGTLLQNAGLIVNRGIIRGSRKEAKLYTCSMSKRKSPGVFLTAKNPPKCNHKLSGQTFCIRFITLHSCTFFILITAISKSCPKC